VDRLGISSYLSNKKCSEAQSWRRRFGKRPQAKKEKKAKKNAVNPHPLFGGKGLGERKDEKSYSNWVKLCGHLKK